MPTSKKSKTSDRIVPRVKVWIEVDGSYGFGRGISEILQAVADTGSIKRAAEKLGKSYRHVWHRVKEAEAMLGVSLVETQVGGKDAQRSHLTQFGQSLVTEFDRLRARMHQVLEEEFPARLRTLLDPD